MRTTPPAPGLLAGLPLLFPLFARSMPPPSHSHPSLLRRTLDPPAAALTALAAPTPNTTFSCVLDSSPTSLGAAALYGAQNASLAPAAGPPDPTSFPNLCDAMPAPAAPAAAATNLSPADPAWRNPSAADAHPASAAAASASSARGGPLLMAYYPAWAGAGFPPEKVDFGRFDWVDFAFAVPGKTFALGWDGSDDAPKLLARLVAHAHKSGKRVKLSVGGWTGSK